MSKCCWLLDLKVFGLFCSTVQMLDISHLVDIMFLFTLNKLFFVNWLNGRLGLFLCAHLNKYLLIEHTYISVRFFFFFPLPLLYCLLFCIQRVDVCFGSFISLCCFKTLIDKKNHKSVTGLGQSPLGKTTF